MMRQHRPHVTAAGAGWSGWTCPLCKRVSDALYTTREAAQTSLDGHLADPRHHYTPRWPFSRRRAD